MKAVDLHLHSTASDGEHLPAEVVTRAAAVGLSAIALTDHDTLAGIPQAVAAGSAIGLRVVAGCELSVAVPWGEMHLLAYFVPAGDRVLNNFLVGERTMRAERAEKIVQRLNAAGVALTFGEVLDQADGAALGRPHVARALVARGGVEDVAVAFDKYLGWGRTAFVAKQLPPVAEVTALVRSVGGVTSAAHLRDRATRKVLRTLRDAGVDGVEVLHPAHDEARTRRVRALADDLALLPTGGSDWHGNGQGVQGRAALGAIKVPPDWLDALARVHQERSSRLEVTP